MRVKEQTLGLAKANGVGLGYGAMAGSPAAAVEGWSRTEATAQIREIVRQNEMAFRLFVAASVVLCALILAAMFLA
jgi:hypothetical protein